MYYYELKREGEYKTHIMRLEYKTYKGALNHLVKQCKKPLNNDYKKRLASTFYVVISDELNRIVCNCHYRGNAYIIYETDNIGRFIKETKIENEG